MLCHTRNQRFNFLLALDGWCMHCYTLDHCDRTPELGLCVLKGFYKKQSIQ